MDIVTAFAAAGLIIFIGFFGLLLFERTKIPDLLILIFLGVLFGPYLLGFVDSSMVDFIDENITPYFAALALMIILFDGGLNLKFDEVIGQIGCVTLFVVVTFCITVIGTTAIAHFLLDYTILKGLMLGAIIGGTSGPVVIPLVRRMTLKESTRTLLTLEGVLTDVLCVIVLISLIEIYTSPTSSYLSAFESLASAFSIAIVVALIFGILWLKILTVLYGKPFSFMITIAAVFVLYALVETLKGSGAVAALIFGIILSNKDDFARMFKIKTIFLFDDKIKQFHSEFSFIIRTFFFVYLGIVFTVEGFDLEFLIISILLLLAIVGTRILTSFLIVNYNKNIRSDFKAICIMLPRGLAAAVLASIPFSKGVENSQMFIVIAFLIIVYTVSIATVGTFLTEHEKSNKKEEQVPSTPIF